MYDNSRKSPNFKSDFGRLSPVLKLNYHTKFPCKNNHNNDPCLPANDQKMVCQTLVFSIIFSTQHDVQTCLDTKKCLPDIETPITSRLDIALAAPRKTSFDFLDERRKRSRNDKLLSTRRQQTCPPLLPHRRLYRDVQCATLHIRK